MEVFNFCLSSHWSIETVRLWKNLIKVHQNFQSFANFLGHSKLEFLKKLSRVHTCLYRHRVAWPGPYIAETCVWTNEHGERAGRRLSLLGSSPHWNKGTNLLFWATVTWRQHTVVLQHLARMKMSSALSLDAVTGVSLPGGGASNMVALRRLWFF